MRAALGRAAPAARPEIALRAAKRAAPRVRRSLVCTRSSSLRPFAVCCAPASRPAQIVETEHLTKALLEQTDSLVKRILEKAGADAAEALRATQRFIERQPRVSGAATQVLGRNLEALVDNARKHRDAASDECAPAPGRPRGDA